MTPAIGERRHFSRIEFDGPAQLQTPDAIRLDVQVVDVSLKGVLLELPGADSLSVSGAFELTIPLNDDIRIVMSLDFAHQEGARAGFHCSHIDMDSMGHLRRLVELNLGDSEALRRELGDMAEDL
ncbi:PilZ domain-containing protein [Aquisalimonas sp. 2447]|uniref:PilZ domain-containing protein n=1 Tax=Aquisalimonas sp. 2447 TaxID=2740807 RepID=UPI0014326C22|nr:PilZ domain-containing protein [Aquisalimonas sp. 2447]QIT56000.1 PilZ domain-containing protein [Aquisalimonas sp. 2447]